MAAWRCTSCRHVVVADEKPTDLHWDDGHICHFSQEREYFKFDDLVDVPSLEGTIFYQGKEDEDDGSDEPS